MKRLDYLEIILLMVIVAALITFCYLIFLAPAETYMELINNNIMAVASVNIPIIILLIYESIKE